MSTPPSLLTLTARCRCLRHIGQINNATCILPQELIDYVTCKNGSDAVRLDEPVEYGQYLHAEYTAITTNNTNTNGNNNNTNDNNTNDNTDIYPQSTSLTLAASASRTLRYPQRAKHQLKIQQQYIQPLQRHHVRILPTLGTAILQLPIHCQVYFMESVLDCALAATDTALWQHVRPTLEHILSRDSHDHGSLMLMFLIHRRFDELRQVLLRLPRVDDTVWLYRRMLFGTTVNTLLALRGYPAISAEDRARMAEIMAPNTL